MLLALLAAAMVVASGTTAFAHRGHDDGGRAKERLFTLTPDPAGNPEGIEFDKHARAFYVSITADGAIYRGTLGSDTVTPFIAGPKGGGSAVGLEKHRGKLYVAGGASGKITVYDLNTKQAVATFDTGTGGFLNDLVVTKRGDVYVTDSFRPTLWHVTGDQVKAGSGTPQALDVSATEYTKDQFNLNGIVSKRPDRLVVVNSFTGKLFRIDLAEDGKAVEAIDEIEGVTLKGGDGMILDRGKLVVVTGNPAQLNSVKLKDEAARAELRGMQTSPLLKGPSTVARAKGLYLVVNADFATSTKPFTVAGLPADGRDDDHGDNRGDHRGPGRGDDDGRGGRGHG
jgi:Cu-Zn family superoxide dismutase